VFGISRQEADSPSDATVGERTWIGALIALAVAAGVAVFGSGHAVTALLLSVIGVAAS
jgi:hypothetical protein